MRAVNEIWHGVERIGGGLAGLAVLGVLVVYVPVWLRALWRLCWRSFAALWRAFWGFTSALAAFRRDPWASLQRWSDRSTLLTLLIYPPLWLLERFSPLATNRAAGDHAVAGALELTALACLADRRGELTVHGIWVLAEALRGFCDQHRHPLWRFGEPSDAQIAAWHQALLAALAPWARIRVHREEFEASWGRVARVYLSEGEWRCSAARLARPFRHPWTLALSENQAARIPLAGAGQAIDLIDLIKTRHGVDALIDRLDAKCVAPYQAIDLPPLADEAARHRKLWTWANGESYPIALAWPDLAAFASDPETLAPVLIPRIWGSVEKSWGGLGPLRVGAGHTIIVANAAGESGIVALIDLRDAVLGDVVGSWLQACRWRYLHGGCAGERGPVFEAAQSLAPNAQGEIVCDLIDGVTGERLNPDGLRILAASLERDGCIAINDGPNADSPKRVDWMSVAGRLLHGTPRWSAIAADSEGYRPVRCASNGRWGFVDRDGAIAIAAQFAAVGNFQRGQARAWPAETRELLGLIDTRGAWAIAPQWRRIDAQTRRCFVVQDAEDRWGAIDAQGKPIVALKARELWQQDPDLARARQHDTKASPGVADDRQEPESERLIERIANEWHQKIRQWVKAALHTPPYTLAALAGVFDADATQNDLRQAGLWGLRVRVLRDQGETILQPRSGEEGWLLSHYPVGLSCFDLSVEAPVCGLAVQPEAVIGVAWKNLAAIAPASQSSENAGAAQSLIDAAPRSAE